MNNKKTKKFIGKGLDDIANNESLKARLEKDLIANPGLFPENATIGKLINYLSHTAGGPRQNSYERLIYFYRNYVAPTEQFLRDKIADFLIKNFTLTDFEKKLIPSMVIIARAMDNIFLHWFQYTASPINKIGSEKFVNEAYKTGLLPRDNPNGSNLTIAHRKIGFTDNFELENLKKDYKAVALSQACPKEISAIARELEKLIPAAPPDYAKYLKALKDAFCSEGPYEDVLWEKVDREWVGISKKNRFLIFHQMESGYTAPQIIEPEIRLFLRSGEHRDKIHSCRRQLSGWLSKNGNLPGDIDKLNNTDISFFINLMSGGSTGIHFRMMGQSVPNRPNVQKEGIRIYLDESGLKETNKEYKKFYISCLHPDTRAWVNKNIKVNDLAAPVFEIAGHEYSHPIFIDNELLKSFQGIKTNVEEGKATLISVINAAENGPVGKRKQLRKKLMAFAMLRIVKFLHPDRFRAEGSIAPYVNECQMMLKTLLDEKAVRLEPEGIFLEPDYDLFILSLNKLLNKIIGAYRDKNRPKIEKIIDYYCDRQDPEISAIVKYIGKTKRNI